MINPTFNMLAQMATTIQSLASATHNTSHTQPPAGNIGRAVGDTRSVEQITNGPLFDIFKQRDFHHLANDFYKQVGGNWNDAKLGTAEQADVAANAERVLTHIDQMGGNGSLSGNLHIEGYRSPSPFAVIPTKDGNTTEGSEARNLLNFASQGYASFQQN